MRVTLYTKPDCSLCLQAEGMLRDLSRVIRFQLDLVYTEADDSPGARYRDRVPVVTVDGEEVASAPLDARRLRRILSA